MLLFTYFNFIISIHIFYSKKYKRLKAMYHTQNPLIIQVIQSPKMKITQILLGEYQHL